MGLFDLPAPLFDLIDGLFSGWLPSLLRLILWGILAGWLTMIVYRRLSNLERIQELKGEQKRLQREIADFDGEMSELMPLIRHTLGLGMRQLGLSLGPALLATFPILFLLVWVAGEFGYEQPDAGDPVTVEIASEEAPEPALAWNPTGAAKPVGDGWALDWPAENESVRLLQGSLTLLELPAAEPIPVIHQKRWWNILMANPIGYLPPDSNVERVSLRLPPQDVIGFGPPWMRGWMFSFFLSFLLASVAFKLILRID